MLETAVSIKAEINAGVVIDLCHEMIDALTVTVDEVQYIVDNPVGYVLTIDGVVVALDAVATIVVALLYVSSTPLVAPEKANKLIIIHLNRSSATHWLL